MRLNVGSGPYAVMPNPKDGSIWYTSGTFGGAAGFLRYDPKTKLSELLSASSRKPSASRGGDIDSNGAARGSGSGGRGADCLRSQQVQRPLNGLDHRRHGVQCPEGFTLYKYPGPLRHEPAELVSRGELLHLGRPARRCRPRQRTSPDLDRKPAGRLRRPRQRQKWCG